jgi:2-oxoisovalerate dehydrogenase E1 component
MVNVDGSDVIALGSACERVLANMRDGSGPAVMIASMDRLDSHTSSDDQRVYRSQDELVEMRDPIESYSRTLLAEGIISESELDEEYANARIEVDSALACALSDPADSAADVRSHLFAPSSNANNSPRDGFDNTTPTMQAAVNRALTQCLESDPRCLVFGQDVEDPKGGVFGLTKGLSSVTGVACSIHRSRRLRSSALR